MGLFGYNKRDFEKNTQKFKAQIGNITQLCTGTENNKIGDIIKYLTKAHALLTRCDYNESSRDYQKIDEEIYELLSRIEKAVLSKEWKLASSFAMLLCDRIHSSRTFGKIYGSDEERELERARAEITGKMYDLLDRAGVIDDQQAKILDAAASLPRDQRDKYELEYNSLEFEKASIKKSLDQYSIAYDKNLECLHAIQESELHRSMELMDAVSGIISDIGDLINRKSNVPPKVKKVEETEVACAYCGYPSEPGARFCKNCGQPLK